MVREAAQTIAQSRSHLVRQEYAGRLNAPVRRRRYVREPHAEPPGYVTSSAIHRRNRQFRRFD